MTLLNEMKSDGPFAGYSILRDGSFSAASQIDVRLAAQTLFSVAQHP